MSYHHQHGPIDAHCIHCWVYDTAAKRDAHDPVEGSADPIEQDDVDKHRVCYVKQDRSFHFLVGLTPLAWKKLGA